MTNQANGFEPKLAMAIEELKALVLIRFPDAVFDVFTDDAEVETRLVVIVDYENIHDVIGTFVSRWVDMEVDDDIDLRPVVRRPDSDAHRGSTRSHTGQALLRND